MERVVFATTSNTWLEVSSKTLFVSDGEYGVSCHLIHAALPSANFGVRGRISRGHPGGRSVVFLSFVLVLRLSFAVLSFHQEEGSAVRFPCRAWSRTLYTHEIIIFDRRTFCEENPGLCDFTES